MSDGLNFNDRMFLEEAVYQRILDDQVTDVDAELMDANLRATADRETS